MKKCPFCAEGIQDDAIKCKHCGEWLSNEKMKLPTKSPDIQPIGKNKDNENYEFRCAFCKSNVGINDLECPNCGKNLGESEINEDELENIISTGPEKAYTTLATLLDTGKKEKTIALGERFINKYPTSRQAKWASKIIEDAKRLESRKLKIIKEKEKFCPNCKRIMEMTQAICQCGYNFDEPNIGLIKEVQRKRMLRNRLGGIAMVIVGGGYAIIRWPSYLPEYQSLSHPNIFDHLVIGLPALLIIFGIYALISGKALKKPTDTVFDNILGDPKAKDAKDDIPYIMCGSCGKQILVEQNYKKCPSCGKKLRTNRKKIAWLIGLLVVIGILSYFAFQIGLSAKESLHVAAMKGDLLAVENLIKKGKDVNASTPKGFTPLHAAVMENGRVTSI